MADEAAFTQCLLDPQRDFERLGAFDWVLLFLSLTIYTAIKIPKRSMEEDAESKNAVDGETVTRWPFFAFLGGAMFCLLASGACHLLSCHSKRISYIVHRLDYAGIAALFRLPSSHLCITPSYVNHSLVPSTRITNTLCILFFGMGTSGVAPIVQKLTLFWHQPEAFHTSWYEVVMGILYSTGGLVYATRIPERWPGKFDIAGQSHQLFHVLVVAGAYTHYRAGLLDRLLTRSSLTKTKRIKPMQPESEFRIRSNPNHASSDPNTPRGVKDDLSEFTKSLTSQFWGVVSFLAPPPPDSTERKHEHPVEKANPSVAV
ncbi:Heptahelical transmembrane protein 4 [Hibiscus syriacus]|uniref:Heptahelical transmembrane protein 4 n=1 Tax=Hibiscus syriacus TaxID=106335 RepID=A0A6A3BJZ9_HIBSY|nr:Heptahelical transmembrane protein 4 [Hibiscus syriacus]